MSLARAVKLPYPGYLWFVLRSTAVVWLLVRLFLFAFLLLVVREDVWTAAGQPTFGLAAVLVWIDRKRCNEQLLHANLGASELWFWSVSLLGAVGLDLLAELALRSL